MHFYFPNHLSSDRIKCGNAYLRIYIELNECAINWLLQHSNDVTLKWLKMWLIRFSWPNISNNANNAFDSTKWMKECFEYNYTRIDGTEEQHNLILETISSKVQLSTTKYHLRLNNELKPKIYLSTINNNKEFLPPQLYDEIEYQWNN